jgi:hypothetical protein
VDNSDSLALTATPAAQYLRMSTNHLTLTLRAELRGKGDYSQVGGSSFGKKELGGAVLHEPI